MGPQRSVVVLGAGYAGTMAANRLLASLTEAERAVTTVSVVNPRDRFVQRVRLHELLAGSAADVSVPLAQMLHPDAQLVLGEATAIDAAGGVVHIKQATGPRELAYDQLVYAIGSADPSAVPGTAAHAHFVASERSAKAAAQAVAAVLDGGVVAVVGGGLTGVETASEIAASRPALRVTLVAGSGLLAGFGERARRKAARALDRLGVQLLVGERVEAVEANRLVLASSPDLAFDVCVWAGGFAVPQLAALSGLDVDEAGRLLVREDLTALSWPNIVGAGDASSLPDTNGAHLRMGCAAALPLGGHAADTVLHHLRGTPTAPASVGYVVQCLSLGRKSGVIQVVGPGDTPRPIVFSGRLGAWFKEYICRLSVSAPRKESRKPGSYWAPKGPKSAAPSAAVLSPRE